MISAIRVTSLSLMLSVVTFGHEPNILACLEHFEVPDLGAGVFVNDEEEAVFVFKFSVSMAGQVKNLEFDGTASNWTPVLRERFGKLAIRRACWGRRMSVRLHYTNQIVESQRLDGFRTVKFRSPNEFVITYLTWRGGK